MPAWRQMSLTGTPASACLRIETIWVSVNFDFFMEPPGWENMPESSTFVVSADQGSLRFRKGRPLARIRQSDCNHATAKLKQRPRKRYGFQTPTQRLQQLSGALHFAC